MTTTTVRFPHGFVHVSRSVDDDVGECHRCGELAPIGGDCPSPKCVAFREWALAHQDDEEKTP